MGGMAEEIIHDGKILAIVARAQSINSLTPEEKMAFVTPNSFPFQIGVHHRSRGETIKPHFHIPFSTLTDFPVQEFFYVISGMVKIDLYDDRKKDAKVAEVTIVQGDLIVLNTGHGFTFLDDARLVELKQGPYRGREQEKRFVGEKV